MTKFIEKNNHRETFFAKIFGYFIYFSTFVT